MSYREKRKKSLDIQSKHFLYCCPDKIIIYQEKLPSSHILIIYFTTSDEKITAKDKVKRLASNYYHHHCILTYKYKITITWQLFINPKLHQIVHTLRYAAETQRKSISKCPIYMPAYISCCPLCCNVPRLSPW